ncbi:MAG: hypothetical protein WAW31_13940 [Smithella sp.]
MEKTLDQIKKEKADLKKEKTASRKKARELLEKKGSPKICEYCHINEEEFSKVWGGFYGGKRGKRLEPDHKDNNYKNNNINNLCWACCLCNCAKSDKLTHQEMIEVGAVIKKIWRKRAVIIS